jgi:PAS domain S-box-containing protein
MGRGQRDGGARIMDEKKKTVFGSALDSTVHQSEQKCICHQKPVVETWYSTLFEQTALGVVYINATGHWLHINQKFCDIVGYTYEELQQHLCQEIMYPEDIALFQAVMTTTVTTQAVEMRYVRKDAQLIWINMILSSPDSQTENGSYLIGFVEDITIRKQLALQSELERIEAQAYTATLHTASRQMEDFLGIATHELRTPLTTIKANTQLAMRRLKNVLQPSAETSAGSSNKISAAFGMLERAERQISVLNRLVGDMLDVSRIRAGRLQTNAYEKPFNLVPLIEAVIQEQRRAIPDRTIKVYFPVCDQILIKGDPERIGQVVSNYIANALKFSEANQPVLIELQFEQQATDKPTVRVNVQDKGQGLKLEEQQHVWKCFYQAPTVKALSGSSVGLGLGLYISQALIELHDGSVGVTSQPDAGSTFWFTLPLA